MTWKSRDILNSRAPLIENGVKRFIELNPDWVVEMSEDSEVDDYLKQYLSQQDYQLIANEHIVAKSDLWRLIKIYNEGGMYLDIDRLCNKKLEIDDEVRWVLPTCREHDFSQDIMISAPVNPVFLATIKLHLERRQQGHNNVYFLGAQTYMHAITMTVFDKLINTAPGDEEFKWMMNEFSKVPFIKTFREDPPHYTILYDGDISNEQHEAMKRAFYASTNTKHWTNEW